MNSSKDFSAAEPNSTDCRSGVGTIWNDVWNYSNSTVTNNSSYHNFVVFVSGRTTSCVFLFLLSLSSKPKTGDVGGSNFWRFFTFSLSHWNVHIFISLKKINSVLALVLHDDGVDCNDALDLAYARTDISGKSPDLYGVETVQLQWAEKLRGTGGFLGSWNWRTKACSMPFCMLEWMAAGNRYIIFFLKKLYFVIIIYKECITWRRAILYFDTRKYVFKF